MIIHVHADKFIGQVCIQIARVRHRMFHRYVTMCQTIIDALADDGRKFSPDFERDISSNDITAERQRQSGFALPPLAKIDNFSKTRASIGELTLVDDQTGLGPAVVHGVKNLIERHNYVLEFSKIELQREKSARHSPWHRDHTTA